MTTDNKSAGDDEAAARARALGERYAKGAQDADFSRFMDSGHVDIERMAFHMIRHAMHDQGHASRSGYLLTHAKVALRMLAMESGKHFAAWVAVNSIFRPSSVRIANFVVPWLLVAGLLTTAEQLQAVARFVLRLVSGS